MKKTQTNLKILEFIKNSYSDEKFFMCKKFKDKVNSLAKMVTNRYKHNKNYVPISTYLMWDEGNDLTACTDNNVIKINMAYILLKGLDKSRRTLAIWGLLAHELGHCLYTDFILMKQFLLGDWDYKSHLSYEAYKFYEEHKIATYMILKDIQNIYEDPYVEYRITSIYTGSFKRGIIFIRELLVESIIKKLNLKQYDVYTLLLAQARNCLPEEYLTKYPCLKKTQKYFDKIYSSNLTMEDRLNITLEIFDIVFDTFIKNQDNKTDEEIARKIEQMRKNNQNANSNSNDNQNSSGIAIPIPIPQQSSESSNEEQSSNDDNNGSENTSESSKKEFDENNSEDSSDEKDTPDNNASASSEDNETLNDTDKTENEGVSDNNEETDDEEVSENENCSDENNVEDDDLGDCENDAVENSSNSENEENSEGDENDSDASEISDKDEDFSENDEDEYEDDDDDSLSNEEDENSNDSENSDSSDGSESSNKTDSSEKNENEDEEYEDNESTDNSENSNSSDNSDSSDETDSSNDETNNDENSEDNSDSENNDKSKLDDSDAPSSNSTSNSEFENSYDESDNSSNNDEEENADKTEENDIEDLPLPEMDVNNVIESVAKSLCDDNDVLVDYTKHEITNEILTTEFHHNVPFEIKKVENGPKDVYQKYLSEVKKISKQAQNKVRDAVLQRKRSQTLKKQMSGNRLDINAYCKRKRDDDFNVFINSKKPSKNPLMAVSTVVDASGSMTFDNGQKIQYATIASIILEDFCRNLGIPFSLISHTTKSKSFTKNFVRIHEFMSFDGNAKQERYSIAKIPFDTDMFGANRDGFAIRYAMNNIKYRREPFKVIFVISDGLPNDENYNFYEAKADIADIRKECHKKGIQLIAFAIDGNIKALEELYGKDNLVDCRNLSKFPKEISRVLAEKSAKVYKN